MFKVHFTDTETTVKWIINIELLKTISEVCVNEYSRVLKNAQIFLKMNLPSCSCQRVVKCHRNVFLLSLPLPWIRKNKMGPKKQHDKITSNCFITEIAV